MKFLTLIDFTETARVAVKQTTALARLTSGSVKLAHVAPQNITDEEENELYRGFEDWCKIVTDAGIQCEVAIGKGDFFSEAEFLVQRNKPDLVVVGNHGKKGLKQNLFGSNIFKLIQKLSCPSLVVNDHTRVNSDGFMKAMLTIAPHADFIKKIHLTESLLHPDGQLVLLNVLKPGISMDDDRKKNYDDAIRYLENGTISWKDESIDSQHFSIGYSREIVEIAERDGYDVISIMSEILTGNKNFSIMDKENIILNPNGIPVLCVK